MKRALTLAACIAPLALSSIASAAAAPRNPIPEAQAHKLQAAKGDLDRTHLMNLLQMEKALSSGIQRNAAGEIVSAAGDATDPLDTLL
jgi:hypothetical protein